MNASVAQGKTTAGSLQRCKLLHARLQCSHFHAGSKLKQSSYTSEPSRTSTTALGHVLPLQFCRHNKRFQIHMLHRQANRNSSELIRTDPNTDGQQRKHTKQIQKLSKRILTLENNCSGKSTFDKVQTSAGTMPKSSVTFPITNGRKMQETRTMSILPFSN